MSSHSDANLSSDRLHDHRLREWRISSPSPGARPDDRAGAGRDDHDAGEDGGRILTAMLLVILTISESHSREIPSLRRMVNLLSDVQAGAEDRATKVRRLYEEVMSVRTKLD